MIIDKNDFCETIEYRYASATINDKSIISTIITLCDEHNIEYDKVAPLLNRSIIEKVEVEANHYNMLKTKNNTHSLKDFV